MFSFFTRSKQNPPPAPGAPVTLLVIQSDNYNWESIFNAADPAALALPSGRKISVVQTGWNNIIVGPCDNYASDPTRRCSVAVTRRWVDGKPVEGPMRVENIRPDFVLIRNEVVTAKDNHRDKLLGLMYCNVPSVNALTTIYMNIERPVMMAAVNAAKDRFGAEAFPIIEQSFFPSDSGFFYGNSFPAVIKYGSAHAGVGKMKISDHHMMEDARTVLPLTRDGYAFAEPFIEGEYDLRIQKIGTVVRVFKRVSVSGAWKTNTGTSVLDEIPLTEEYARWADIAGKMFGTEMDICTVDAIVDARGKAYILEVNGTSSGLCPAREVDDNNLIRDLVVAKMRELGL